MRSLMLATAAVLALALQAASAAQVLYYEVPRGAHPHDVAPAPDGSIWYTAQAQAALGILDPRTGKTTHVALGKDAMPHGVIAGPDRAAWITETGQNAIARFDPVTKNVKLFSLPSQFPNANLNTATFDRKGILWFTGQNGVYGRVDPAGASYGPYHDIEMIVDGDAARALSEIARSRWSAASTEDPAPVADEGTPWPDCVHPDFHNVTVGIARTRPESPELKRTRSSRKL